MAGFPSLQKTQEIKRVTGLDRHSVAPGQRRRLRLLSSGWLGTAGKSTDAVFQRRSLDSELQESLASRPESRDCQMLPGVYAKTFIQGKIINQQRLYTEHLMKSLIATRTRRQIQQGQYTKNQLQNSLHLHIKKIPFMFA